MKIKILKILLYLCCSTFLGVESGMHYFSDGYNYTDHICEGYPEFEDDICFDIFVHSMWLDLEENSNNINIILSKRPVEWPIADVNPSILGITINLPLRAPPPVG